MGHSEVNYRSDDDYSREILFLKTEEKMMKSAIVCVSALILLAINVEGATYCHDGCTAEKGKAVEKCRTVKCNGGGMCVSRRRPDSIMADGCTYIKIAPG